MNRSLILWGSQKGIGRRTLARELARVWSESGKSVLLFTVCADKAGLEESLDWVPRFACLSPLLLRNFLQKDGSYAHLDLEGWPISETLPKLASLLKQSFDWVICCTPQTFSQAEVAWLDQVNVMLYLAKPESTLAGNFNSLLEKLSAAHLPHAFCQIVLNRVPPKMALPLENHKILPGRSVLHQIVEDPGNGLRLKEGVQQLVALLEKSESLYAPHSSQKNMEVSEKTIEEIKNRVQPQLMNAMTHEKSESTSSKPILEESVARKTVETCLAQDVTLTATRQERSELLTKVLDEVLGLGPLEPLLKDPSISEVMVNSRACVYVEKKGCLHATDVKFSSDAQLRAIIDRIVSPIGRRVDESMPLCDARLADGSRVNIVLPPLALDGPSITIRKFAAKALSFEDLVRGGSLSPEMADFLRRCIIARKNIVVSGGTGSGKTTLLNALSSQIPDDERIVTIEDAAELKLQKPHVVRLESRPANAEGEGAIPIRRLVINALRMRPDRIVVGECRGGEALDMLQAMNTGHDGSLTTVHANTPRDALGRLETLVLMAGMDLPVRVVREQIKSAVQ